MVGHCLRLLYLRQWLFYFVLIWTDVSLHFSIVNRINLLYYCDVCLCIISIGNFAIDIKPRAFSV